jgi:hypothetical protein
VAYEKRLKAVPSQLFTADGTNLGKVTIPDACAFKVKQQVILSSSTQGPTRLEVKRVDGDTVLFVGPISDHQHKSSISERTNISAYLVADGASIYAEEQKRPNIPEQEIERLTYEEEPTVARRVILVDDCGDKIGSVQDSNGVNRLAVDANVSVDFGDTQINIENPDKVKITNIPVPLANTEMSHTLVAKSDRFAIKVRDGEASTRLAFVAGQTATNYTKINRGVVFDCGSMDLTAPFTIYFSTDKPGVVIEVINWYFS